MIVCFLLRLVILSKDVKCNAGDENFNRDGRLADLLIDDAELFLSDEYAGD